MSTEDVSSRIPMDKSNSLSPGCFQALCFKGKVKTRKAKCRWEGFTDLSLYKPWRISLKSTKFQGIRWAFLIPREPLSLSTVLGKTRNWEGHEKLQRTPHPRDAAYGNLGVGGNFGQNFHWAETRGHSLVQSQHPKLWVTLSLGTNTRVIYRWINSLT